MKIKNSNLKWYVLRYDSNNKKITEHNVMVGIAEAIQIEVKAKRVYDKKSLKNFLKKEFMHNYWCRAEHEILVSGLHDKDAIEKIDIYRQLNMNLDTIVDYVNSKCDLKFE